jgi:hypothetical protein
MRELRLSRGGRRPSKTPPVENVLRQGLRLERVPDPSVVVLFGATGDLAHRKVFPALYQLWRTDLLPHEFQVLGIGRRPLDDEGFRKGIRKALEAYSRVLPLDEAAWHSFAERIAYQRCDFEEPIQPWMRPGMSGVAKLDVGERSLLWVVTHRTMDFLRMYFWW